MLHPLAQISGLAKGGISFFKKNSAARQGRTAAAPYGAPSPTGQARGQAPARGAELP